MESNMKWFLTLIFYFFIGSISTKVINNKFPFSSMSLCKEHDARDGYSYNAFYSVDATERRTFNKSIDIVLEMHIAILAASNGHILLSSVPHPDQNDPVYEIVVGGGSNRFSELRRNLKRNAKTSSKTVGILSAIEFRAFYIKISEDGEIEFGKEGDILPVLAYKDHDRIDVKYFSFAAWSGVDAKFLYDCPEFSENGTEIFTTNSSIIEPKLSYSDQLKRDLLINRYPHLPPGPSVNIKLAIIVANVRYNAFESKMTTRLSVVLSWEDPSMAWDPNSYNGTTKVVFRPGQIWRPTFFVYNSGDIGAVDAKSTEPVTMVNSGEATFHFDTSLSTWCSDGTSTWPEDQYNCFIAIGPWEPHEKITLEEMGPNDEKWEIVTNVIEDVIEGEWETELKHSIVVQSDWKDIFNLNDEDSYQSDRIVMKFTLKRRALSYNIVFYTPLYVLITFVIISFWTVPLNMSRVWFYAIITIIMCIGMSYIDYLVPSYNVPNIFVTYTVVLFGVLLALLVQVTLMTPTAKRLCKARPMNNLLLNRIVRMLFCLKPVKNIRNYESMNEAFAEDSDEPGVSTAARNNNLEEMQTELDTVGEMIEVAEILDKSMFVVYTLTFIVMLSV